MVDIVKIGYRADTSDLRRADKDMQNLSKSGAQVDKSLGQIEKTAGRLGAVMATLAGALSVRQLIQYADAYTNIQNRLRVVTENTAQLAEVQSELLDISNRTLTSLEASAILYSRTARATEELGISQDRLLRIIETVNKSFAISGATAQEAENAIRQLSQGLAAGALRGEEFNSVAEQAPEILRAVSRETGMAVGQLREFAAEGGITAELLIRALENYEQEVDRAFGNIDATFGQSIVTARNNVVEFVGEIETSQGVIGLMGDSLVGLSENLETVTDVALIMAGVFAGRVAGSLAGKIAAFTAAQVQAFRYQATLATMAGVSRTTAAALGTMSVAARGATAALGFLGGPLGVAVLAGVALYTFTDSASAAEVEAAKLRTEVDELTQSFIGLEEAQVKARFDEESIRAYLVLPTEIRRLKNELDGLNESILARTEGLGAPGSVSGLSPSLLEDLERAQELEAAIEKLTLEQLAAEEVAISLGDRLVELAETRRENTKAIEEEANAIDLDAYDKITQRLKDQIFEMENGKRAYEIMIALREANVSEMSAEGQELIRLINLKYRSKEATDAEGESYAQLLGLFDQNQAALNRYYEQAQRIVSAQLTQAQTTELLTAAWQDYQDTIAGDSGGTNELDDMISKVDEFGGAWTRAGSAMARAAGDIVSHLDDYAAKMAVITQEQEKLTKKRAEYIDGSEEALKADKALGEWQRIAAQTQINSIATISGMASQMFDEQSEARRKLHQMEITFTAIETAMQLEKAIGNAVAAVTNQGSGDPYTAFARVAAMSAMMAGVLSQAGVAFGSTSGGYSAADVQAQQGTGTVFGGDAEEKSESILRAVEITADANLDQIIELRALRDSMRQLSDGIAQLAVSLVGSSGFGAQFAATGSSQSMSGLVGFAGDLGLSNVLGGFGDIFIESILGSLFGSTKRELVDYGISFDTQSLADILATGLVDAAYFNVIETTKKKLFGLIKKTGVSTEYADIDNAILEQFGSIFGFITDSIFNALDSLGLEAQGSLQSFMLDLGDISFEGMTGEEVQQELEAIFSQQADLIVDHLVPAMGQYQQMGEGLFETLIRVANEQAQFNATIERLGFDLSELSAIMGIDVAQSVITLMGGLEQFSDATSTYFDKFFTDAEKLDVLSGQLNKAFGQLGFELPTTVEGFRKLVDGIDLTRESGQALFAALMELAPFMAEYLDMLEDQGLTASALAESARDALDELYRAVAAERQLAKERLDNACAAYDAEVDRVNGLMRALDEAKRLADEALRSAEMSVNAAFDAEIRRQQALAQERIDAISDEINLQRELSSQRLEAINAEISATQEMQRAAEELLQVAERDLRAAFGAEAERLSLASQGRVEAINTEIAAVEEMQRAAEELLQVAERDLRAAFDAEADRIKSQLDDELAALGLRQEANNDAISAANDMANALSGLSDGLRGTVDSIAEQSTRLTLLRRQQTQSSIRDAIALARMGDFSAAMGLDLSALSDTQGLFSSASERAFDVAVTQQVLSELADLTDAQLSIEERTINALERQNEQLDEQAEQLRTEADEQLAALDAQLNALLGIDTSVMSVADTIEQWQEAQEAQQDFTGIIDKLEAQIEQERKALDDQLSALDAQLNALLGIDTSVLSVAEAITQWQEAQAAQQDFDAMIAELEAQAEQERESLDTTIAALEAQIAQEQESLAATIEALNAQRDAVLGVDNTVKSIAEATAEYQAAQLALDELAYDDTMALYQQMLDSAAEVYALHEQAYEDEMTRLDKVIEDAERRLETLGIINNSVMSVEDAVTNLTSIVSDYVDAFYRELDETEDKKPLPGDVIGAPVDRLPVDGEVTRPPSDGGNRPPAPPPRDDMPPWREDRRDTVAPLAEELKELREEMKAANMAIAKHTAQTAKELQNIALGGLDTRIIQ